MSFGHFFREKQNKRIYLDYAAATPLRSEVFEKMKPYFQIHFGNASAVHKEGKCARDAVESARQDIAKLLRVKVNDITFTSGGTEGNNIAILGHVNYLLENGLTYSDIEIIATQTEHPSIYELLNKLEKLGVVVKYVPVDGEGRVILKDLENLFSPKTRLVTVVYANSETGVVQNLGAISRIVHAYEKENNLNIMFHTDACQALLWLPCEPDSLGVDAMTFDAGKCYGPKGVGVLLHRKKAQFLPVTYGGSQESGLRPGTENTPLLVGCAEAFRMAIEGRVSRSTATAVLRDTFIKLLQEKILGCIVNGSLEYRLANNVNISLPGIDTEFAVVALDTKGVATSTRSACSAFSDSKQVDEEVSGGSHVVLAMTKNEARAKSTIRFSLGEETTKKDIEKTVAYLADHVEKMRRFSIPQS